MKYVPASTLWDGALEQGLLGTSRCRKMVDDASTCETDVRWLFVVVGAKDLPPAEVPMIVTRLGSPPKR